VPAPLAFSYAVVRVVPRVEREEFVNVGVILFSAERRFLGCRLRFDRARLAALAPGLDTTALECHLDAMRAVCEGDPSGGPIAALSASERFHWMVAPRSASIQTSPVHSGLTEDPAAALERLFEAQVAPPLS
jgi:hypothetical protein